MSGPGFDLSVLRIRELDESWKLAATNRDLDAMVDIYSVNAQELLPGFAPVIGREAIRQFYALVFQQLPRCIYEFDQQDLIVAESDELAVVRGRYRFVPDADVPEDARTGKFVGVWRREAGDWRLAINISNEDPPLRSASSSV